MSDAVVICLVLNTAPDLLSWRVALPPSYTVPAFVVLVSRIEPVHDVGAEVCGHDGAETTVPPAAGRATEAIASAATTEPTDREHKPVNSGARIASASWPER